MTRESRKALFLDRDGTLIDDVPYPRDPERVQLLPGVVEALRRIQAHGFLLVLVSNQSGIGRGLITPEEAAAVAARFEYCLRGEGIHLAGSYYCPHAPEDGCACRKPEPGMVLRAAEELNLSLAHSFLVGDKPSDIEAGQRAGCRTILYAPSGSAVGGFLPDRIALDWDTVLREILQCSTTS